MHSFPVSPSMVTCAPRPWSVHDVPVLNEDGSNAEVWCLVVRAVASQHDASELLARDPHPGDVGEAASADHLKAFLKATCFEKVKPSLDHLSPLQTWKFLQIAVTPKTHSEKSIPPMSPILTFQEGGHLPSNGSAILSPIARTTGHYTMPEGYPARDAILIFTDDDKDFKSCTSETALEEKKKELEEKKKKKEEEEQVTEKDNNESKEKSDKNGESDVKEGDDLEGAKTTESIKEKDEIGEGDGLKKESGQDTSDEKPSNEDSKDIPVKNKDDKETESKDKDKDGKETETKDKDSKTESEVVPISTFRPFSGRRKALIIGINYADGSLSNCVRDAAFMSYLLLTQFNFSPSEIYMLTDDPHSMAGIRTGKPTREGIDEGISWLMRDARAGDSLFFSFSGHGTRVEDYDGDEKDGWDEAICPLDFDVVGNITDDELFHKLVRRVPKGARLTAVTDSCHSGSVLDLPYMYDSMTGERVLDPEPEEVQVEEEEPEKESRVRRILNRLRRRKRNSLNGGSCTSEQSLEAPPFEFEYEPGPRYPTDRHSKGGEVLHISGCTDVQYSTEGNISSKGSGFMSFCLVEAIERGEYRHWQEYTYASLVRTLATKVQAWNHEQWPMFSTSHPFNLDTPFIL